MTAAIEHRIIETNGIKMHLAIQGSGPLVLFCHGFPESWYSWRHQMRAVAEAGFRAVAPDMRGYGETESPAAIDKFTLLHLVGDMVGVLDALDEQQAVVVGHDWGAPVAWHCALLRPDRFRAVTALSVPYRPRGGVLPTSVMPQTAEASFYQLYFQAPGIAEAELDADVSKSLRKILYSGSGDVPRRNPGVAHAGVGMVRRAGGFLTGMPDTAVLPPWLSEADIDTYARQFTQSGFRGGLNWYRNIDRNWELLAPYKKAPVVVPALYIAGELDLVVNFAGMRETIADLKRFVPNLRGTVMLSGCGHWTQQERADEVNRSLLEFLRGL
jgi:pimeloyl-ACP methyl ester carboxylesterase